MDRGWFVVTVGSVFAGYVIKARLGAGGMGVVYLAQHPRLKRDVALKVLHDQWAMDPGTRAAFDREAALISQLDHPNIVQVYDRSDPEDEALWLSMRNVAGGDVAALLAAAPHGLPLEQVLALITDTAYALDHAHAQGVLHRDVKPANLLLEHDPRHGRKAVLTDFGIARAADSATTATSFAMSLPYAAPERFSANRVDHRVDIYSLGCTMFQLLTGQLPFPQHAPVEFMTAHLTAPVPSVLALRPDLPPSVDKVIATVLAKEPADRYHSCRDLVADLRRAITSASSTTTRMLPAENHSLADARRLQAANPANPQLMYSLGLLLKQSGDFAEAQLWLRKAADLRNTNAMIALGNLFRDQDDHIEAEAWYRKAIAVDDSKSAKNNLGYLLEQQGDLSGAESWYRRATAAGNRNAMYNLGRLLKSRGDLSEAETWLRRAAEAGNTNAMTALGNLLRDKNIHTEAEAWYRKAIAADGNKYAITNLGRLVEQRGGNPGRD